MGGSPVAFATKWLSGIWGAHEAREGLMTDSALRTLRSADGRRAVRRERSGPERRLSSERGQTFDFWLRFVIGGR